MMSCCVGLGLIVVGIIILYKFVDIYIRRFRIGQYSERYILVTGCDTGFGNLLCKRLDKLGCHVFAGCYTDTGLQEITKSCSVRLHALSLDVTNPDSVREALKIVKSKLPSGTGLWALMNNAGLMGALTPPEWVTVSDYKFVANVNLYGLIDVTMTFLPLIKLAKGRVVSTSSVAGRVSNSIGIPYNVSKYGVEAFMDGIRRKMCDFGVKCVLIEPGIHNTTFWDKTSSTQALPRVIAKSWDEIPLEAREEYGKEYYDKFISQTLTTITHLGSTRPDDVVDAYEDAILSRYPRPRYVVGKDAHLLWIPLSFAPEWLSDFVLRRLGKDLPNPAALQKKKSQ
jgi:retinol dehydrogenase-16